jgi:NAD(P)-dependent dehydrogenase (short-subunit alcohol dehydrogenase family)
VTEAEGIAPAGLAALVTGAGRSLGRAVALALGTSGVAVAAHYHTSADGAAEVVEAIHAAGGEAWSLRADLSDPGEALALVGRAAEACGRPVGILVNSASVYETSRVLDFGPEELAANVQVNALAPLLLCRAMAAQGRPGSIVNLLDARMGDYDREHAAYHLSKRMLRDLTRMLALELAPGIRVNGVAPGLIAPPDGQAREAALSLAHTNPLQRTGSTGDVAEAVLFLLRSGFITGQTIYVDGGRNLRGSVYG